MPLQEFLQQIFASVLQLFSALFNPTTFIPLVIIVIVCVKKSIDYKKCAYYQITKQSYFSVKLDKGKYGEYLIYKYLKKYENDGAKFLFNVYIPKENGETTEIDVLMISSKGLFVFESKNHSGWIFGSEKQANWYQTLPRGRGRSQKVKFYNPIMQNNSHIKHLESFLDKKISTRSIIVFSERCTLKNINIESKDISVIKRNNVFSVVSHICNNIQADILTEKEIAEIYNKLYPHSQVDDTLKAEHIKKINSKLNPQASQETRSSFSAVTVSVSPQTPILQQDNVASIHEENKDGANDVVEDIHVELKPIEQGNIDIQQHKCPKCNGNLILRTANKGKNAGKRFYGCSNFPKCRYIETID